MYTIQHQLLTEEKEKFQHLESLLESS